MLWTFENFSEFNDIQNKNWDAIAKLIPSTTPHEVRERSLFRRGGGEDGRNGGGGHLKALPWT